MRGDGDSPGKTLGKVFDTIEWGERFFSNFECICSKSSKCFE
jgi:hypothetical protein